MQLLGVCVVGAWTFSASFGVLWTMKKLCGIRVHEEAETLGLDVSEHGMWGYPEFYIPVPGGYGQWSSGAPWETAQREHARHADTKPSPVPATEPA